MSIKIEIASPRSEWAVEFADLAMPIRNALGELALSIDHIGSTSVPGLPAKDIIDIQVTVGTLDDIQSVHALESIGYAIRTDIVADHVPPGANPSPELWRKRYFRAPEGQRPTHLHMRLLGLPNQRYPILFRDYLRSHPAAAATYAQIKTCLARLHPYDVDAYYDIKDPVCDLIVQSAEIWAVSVGWQPGASDA